MKTDLLVLLFAGSLFGLQTALCPLDTVLARGITNKKGYVLRNPKGGATPIWTAPIFHLVGEYWQPHCLADVGTPVILKGRTIKLRDIETWEEIEVMDGACNGTKGWVRVDNIWYE